MPVETSTTAMCLIGSSSMSHWFLLIGLVILSIPTVFYWVSYWIPQLYMAFVKPVPNLKLKYKSEWALVTGAGSGIGRALAFRLAKDHDLNVVLVSLDDAALKQTMADLKREFPNRQFRAVGVAFAPGTNYMLPIEQACQDLDIRIVFSNAGYMVTGFFDTTMPVQKLLANMECNATAGVNLAHYFISKWVQQQQRQPACLVFTSSVAGFIPTPFAALYASTKAFTSQLAACLHIECAPLGIDICAIHPSPVKSSFYQNLDHKVQLIEAAAQSAIAPDAIVNDIITSIGSCAYRDLGSMACAVRLGTFFIPYNLFAQLFATFAPFVDDWKTHNKNRFSVVKPKKQE